MRVEEREFLMKNIDREQGDYAVILNPEVDCRGDMFEKVSKNEIDKWTKGAQ